MASTKEIKNRISSVSDTQKITNAMYLISSTKMRRARREVELTKPYFDLLRREIKRMFAIGSSYKSKYYDAGIDDEIHGGRFGVLVITGDKGLAGAYNQNVIRATDALISQSDEYKLYIVGDHGWRHFKGHGYCVDEDFTHSMNEPTLAMARNITREILEDFDRMDFDRLYVCYTEYKGGISQGEAARDRLIPLDKYDFVTRDGSNAKVANNGAPRLIFEYEPNIETVLESSIQSYLVGYIYSALVNSYSAEQSARMMAMEAANDNASELLSELKLEFNHLRQGAITQEITEISSGARSLKRNKS